MLGYYSDNQRVQGAGCTTADRLSMHTANAWVNTPPLHRITGGSIHVNHSVCSLFVSLPSAEELVHWL